jgi:hypothetical protein
MCNPQMPDFDFDNDKFDPLRGAVGCADLPAFAAGFTE